MSVKRISAVIVCAALLLLSLCACGGQNVQTTTQAEPGTAVPGKQNADDGTKQTKEKETESKETDNMENPRVKVVMKEFGEFVIELYPEYAPETVENFISLVEDGFYNGLTFHRVMPGFMAQGGDPEGTGFGGSEKKIKGEFAANGFKQNTLSHTRGVVSMARSQDPDSASSQFFICYSDEDTFLDGNYAAFGKVVEGMDVVDSFCNVEIKKTARGEASIPATPIVIDTMTVVK